MFWNLPPAPRSSRNSLRISSWASSEGNSFNLFGATFFLSSLPPPRPFSGAALEVLSSVCVCDWLLSLSSAVSNCLGMKLSSMLFTVTSITVALSVSSLRMSPPPRALVLRRFSMRSIGTASRKLLVLGFAAGAAVLLAVAGSGSGATPTVTTSVKTSSKTDLTKSSSLPDMFWSMISSKIDRDMERTISVLCATKSTISFTQFCTDTSSEAADSVFSSSS